MRFLYVNKILEVTDNSIVGEKTFDCGEPLRLSPPGRRRIFGEVSSEAGWVVAPGVISEAIGQLASWCGLSNSGFQGRPVFMFADRIEFFREAMTGEKILLKAKIDSIEEHSMVFSGTAESAAGLICRIVSCHCHLAPLEVMEDPEITKSRFAALCQGGEAYGAAEEFIVAESIVEQKVEHDLGRVSGKARFAAESFFYKDHFPRKPVTPIVLINEVIGELTKSLCAIGPAGGRLQPRLVEALKIRNFVLPEEVFSVEVDLLSKQADENGALQICTSVQVKKEGKPILRGQYSYQWKEC